MEATRFLTRCCVSGDETFDPDTTIKRVELGTVFANCAEMMASALADSGWAPVKEFSWRDEKLSAPRNVGTSRTSAINQIAMTAFLRRKTNRPNRLKATDPPCRETITFAISVAPISVRPTYLSVSIG